MLAKPWLKFYDTEVPAELVIPPLTIPDLLRHAAEKYPHQTAAVFMGARLNYEQLKQQVDRLAALR
jgi:long-chain acyl-CoA synthetase